jgi:RNA polymerase sigma factor (sigma-70 family)
MRDAGCTAPIELGALARAAAAGDELSWNELVARLDRLLRGVVRGYRLAGADVDDVVQTTWMRAFEHVRRLHDPGAIAAWLVITARREAMRTLQRGVREVLTDDPCVTDQADDASPEAIAIQRERRAAVHGAVGRLSGRQHELLAALLTHESPDYDRLSQTLRMPIGSIGPTRQRALDRLRADAELEEAVCS